MEVLTLYNVLLILSIQNIQLFDPKTPSAALVSDAYFFCNIFELLSLCIYIYYIVLITK